VTTGLNEDELYMTVKFQDNQAITIDFQIEVEFMTVVKCVFNIKLMFCLKSYASHAGTWEA